VSLPPLPPPPPFWFLRFPTSLTGPQLAEHQEIPEECGLLASPCMHIMDMVTVRFGDWAKSRWIKVTILPESFPLALYRVTGEEQLSSDQHALSKPQDAWWLSHCLRPKALGLRGLDSSRRCVPAHQTSSTSRCPGSGRGLVSRS
jgi:hypothetical protein